MKANETVIKMKWMSKSVQEDQDRLLLKQAEISFKAGMEEEAKGGTNALSYLKGIEKGEELGARKVVEFIKNPKHHQSYQSGTYHFYQIGNEALQAKLKEWGIK